VGRSVQQIVLFGLASLGLVFVGASCRALTSFDGFTGAPLDESFPDTGPPPPSLDGSDEASVDAGEDVDAGPPPKPCTSTPISTGPRAATLGTLALSSGPAWTNTMAAIAADGVATSSNIPSTIESSILLVGGFGFAIPETAAIAGVKVSILRRADKVGLRETSVRLAPESVPAGAGKEGAEDLPVGTFTAIDYGDATDLWGIPLTPAIVNQPTFGASLRVKNSGAVSGIAEVDEIHVDVTYCE
jgi:hypothetical protein